MRLMGYDNGVRKMSSKGPDKRQRRGVRRRFARYRRRMRRAYLTLTIANRRYIRTEPCR